MFAPAFSCLNLIFRIQVPQKYLSSLGDTEQHALMASNGSFQREKRLNFGRFHLKTYAAVSNAHLFRVCKRGKLSGSCLSTLNGFGSIQLPIFLCHIGVPTFSSQIN